MFKSLEFIVVFSIFVVVGLPRRVKRMNHLITAFDVIGITLVSMDNKKTKLRLHLIEWKCIKVSR